MLTHSYFIGIDLRAVNNDKIVIFDLHEWTKPRDETIAVITPCYRAWSSTNL